MYRKLDNDAWAEYLNKFNSLNDTTTVKNFCEENNSNNSQIYYYKRCLERYLVYIFDNLSRINIKDS